MVTQNTTKKKNNQNIKSYRNKLTHLLRIAEKQYYTTYCDNNKQNISKLWKIINYNVIGKNKMILL